KRVAGNRRLYRDLLGQFVAKQANAAAQISAALEGEDLKLAERIAHTVKGVAGNLGITHVQSRHSNWRKQSVKERILSRRCSARSRPCWTLRFMPSTRHYGIQHLHGQRRHRRLSMEKRRRL